MHPGLTAIPLDGVEPGHVVLATRADDRNRLVAAFTKYARSSLGMRINHPLRGHVWWPVFIAMRGMIRELHERPNWACWGVAAGSAPRP